MQTFPKDTRPNHCPPAQQRTQVLSLSMSGDKCPGPARATRAPPFLNLALVHRPKIPHEDKTPPRGAAKPPHHLRKVASGNAAPSASSSQLLPNAQRLLRFRRARFSARDDGRCSCSVNKVANLTCAPSWKCQSQRRELRTTRVGEIPIAKIIHGPIHSMSDGGVGVLFNDRSCWRETVQRERGRHQASFSSNISTSVITMEEVLHRPLSSPQKRKREKRRKTTVSCYGKMITVKWNKESVPLNLNFM
ncbi:hypothetical protein EUGRSUZ_K01573 [Eucalyptus grandis]|uniref:Uncharacterized protein n=2 Tax=Eucalyptus grandis TaxID=71139 RepID=A0ACC3IUP8_EUCGR|nr:hypothetical protein EUGRSUZ_K01573 [Eucalyptus grandis]